METGVSAFTAFCFAFASASAFCFVLPTCETFCSCPLPPQPPPQLDLPSCCVAVASWFVLLLLDASASALLLTSCDAVLEPACTSPPAMLTGTFAFTAFCLAFAAASASCFVLEDCETFCSWPLPPQPE